MEGTATAELLDAVCELDIKQLDIELPPRIREGLTAMTPEIWTILGTGFTLAALGVTGFTLLWRYIAAAEQRTRADLAAAEKRSEARFAELKSDLAAQQQEVKALGGRMHTLEVQMAKLEGLLEGLREAITGKRAA